MSSQCSTTWPMPSVPVRKPEMLRPGWNGSDAIAAPWRRGRDACSNNGQRARLAPRSSVPPPVLVKPCVPASTVVMVAVRFRTEMVGVPAPVPRVKMLAATPLFARVQSLVRFVWSSNSSEPIVRALSRFTVTFAAMSRS